MKEYMRGKVHEICALHSPAAATMFEPARFVATTLSSQGQKAWLYRFDGDPNGAGLARWPPYDSKNQLLIMHPDGIAASQPDPLKIRLDLATRRAEMAMP